MDASARLAFNMKVLRRHDASIDDILESASFVVLYEHTDDGWVRAGGACDGALCGAQHC